MSNNCKSLAIKRNELEQKNTGANLKLKEMIKDQQKLISQDLQRRHQQQLSEIATNKSPVNWKMSNRQ